MAKTGMNEGKTAKKSTEPVPKEMIDTTAGVPQILTDSVQGEDGQPAGPLKVRFLGTRANVLNLNGRIYPREVLVDAIQRAKHQYVASGNMIGEMPHPKVVKSRSGKVFFDTRIENRVWDIKDLFMDEEGNVFFDAVIIQTSKGRDVEANIRAGKPIPVSMRSLGQSKQRVFGDQQVEVATFLDLSAFDAVGNAATDGCRDVVVLNDSQVTELLKPEVIEDGIQYTVPGCPLCHGTMEGYDPDNDGGGTEVDFYYCAQCDKAFVPSKSLTNYTSATFNLSVVEDDDYDSYSQAREFLRTKRAGKTMTDGKVGEGDDIDVKPEELKAMLDEHKNSITRELEAKYKPVVDAVNAQQTADQTAATAAKNKEEAKAFLDGKIAEMKDKFSVSQLKFITDAVGVANTLQEAETRFDVAIQAMNDTSLGQFYSEIGFTGKPGPDGKIYAEAASHSKPWQPIVDRIIGFTDRYAQSLGYQPKMGLRQYNKPIVDRIVEHFLVGRLPGVSYESMVDNRQYDAYVAQHRQRAYSTFMDNLNSNFKPLLDNEAGFEAMIAIDDVSVGTAQVFNQPTILTVVLVQAFQECEALQFLWNDVFMGKEWRIPVETFTSAETYDSLTGQPDLYVAESQGIPESSIDLGFLHFVANWRRNAVSVTRDVAEELRTGPVHYDTIARAIYHIGFDHRRKIDNAAYDEMYRTADEYSPLAVSNETPEALTAVNDGSNVVYKYSLTGGGTLAASAGRNPVVIPRVKSYLDQNGQLQSVTVNSVTVRVGSSNLVGGYIQVTPSTNVVNVIGTGAGFGIDFENGVIYFTALAGLNPAAATPILPKITYSAVTNLDYFSLTVPEGTQPAFYYNGLLERLTNTSALMGSSPRFKVPNLAIFNRISAAYIQNAQMFYKLAQPEGSRLIAEGTYFGERSEMNLAKVNSPRVNSNRILLTQKGATRYGIQTPYQIKGPFPKYDANGKIIAAELFYGSENSVMCTPQVMDVNGNVLNPVSRTIKLY